MEALGKRRLVRLPTKRRDLLPLTKEDEEEGEEEKLGFLGRDREEEGRREARDMATAALKHSLCIRLSLSFPTPVACQLRTH